MANQVFANGREVSCKAADGKSICAFPDVCLSPPTPPAGPVPIPYPNSGFASDTTDGSRTVTVSGKEVMLKDKSSFKKSTGDEAATKTLGMGVVTHQITGKVFFNSWSMDVKIESENVVRFLDLTTHNHMSVPGNSPTWPYIDEPAISLDHPCVNDMKKEHEACKEYTPHGGKDPCASFGGSSSASKNASVARAQAKAAESDKCLRARRCSLSPYEPKRCCHAQTPHHLVEDSALRYGKGGALLPQIGSNYKHAQAPCVCVEGGSHSVGTHGLMHAMQNGRNRRCPPITLPSGTRSRVTTYGHSKRWAARVVRRVFPGSGCSEACIIAQMDNYYKQCQVGDNTPIRAVTAGASLPESRAALKIAMRG